MANPGSLTNFGNNMDNFLSYGSSSSGGGLSGILGALGGGSDIAGSIGSAIAGYAQNKADQKESARKYAQTKEELAIAAKNDREVKAAQMASDYFYNRMNRDRRRQGVNSIRQFKSDGAVDVYKNPGV